MEIRSAKTIIGAAGGTAGRNAKTYKVALPTSWLFEMGIDERERDITLSFDGHKITVQKRLSFDEFIEANRQQNHKLMLFSYYDDDTLCTRICADFTDRRIAIQNEAVPTLHRAFGVNETPTWEDFSAFLEDRCIPRQRDGLRYYLDALGLDEYDPLEIILRTEGRMAEDQQWLKVEDIS